MLGLALNSPLTPTLGALFTEGVPTGWWLLLAIAVPLLAGVALLLGAGRAPAVTRTLLLIGTIVPAAIAAFLALGFWQGPHFAGYRYYLDVSTGLDAFGISLKVGLNGVSLPLYLLAAIVGLAAGLYALRSVRERQAAFAGLLLVMHGGLMGVFSSVDIFFFYVFHEIALIPTFVMMAIWGGLGRRTITMEMTLYLSAGALLALLGLVALYVESGYSSFDFLTFRQMLAEAPLDGSSQRVIFGLLLFGFGILVSLFPFHAWAPRGYGAAPAPVAMLHAGVLKKFGLYGLLQIAVPLLPQGVDYWREVLVWLALGNVVIIGLATMAQRDLKLMIGYSSVMHMGYAFLGIAALSVAGVGGAVLMMFAHGVSVALLFLLADCVERRVDTCDMKMLGGLSKQTPILAAFFVAAIMASIGLPGFANFWGELAIFTSLWSFQAWLTVPVILGIVISAIYGLRAVARVFFGEPSVALTEYLKTNEVKDLDLKERVPAVILVLALLVVGVWPRLVSEPLHTALDEAPPRVEQAAADKETAPAPVLVREDAAEMSDEEGEVPAS